MQTRARICPLPSSKISSASAAVGSPAAQFPRSLTRSFSPKPQPLRGDIACAFALAGDIRTPGFGRASPSRRQLPHSVLRHRIKYSVRFPRGDMLGPVPAAAAAFVPPANILAAATRSSSSTPALCAAYPGVKSNTASASRSKPWVLLTTKSLSYNPSRMITWINPASSVGSSPGRDCK